MDEFIDGVQHGDLSKMVEYMSAVDPDTISPGYIYSVRFAIEANDPQMLNFLIALVPYSHIFDPDTVMASVMSNDVMIFKSIIGPTNIALKSKFTVHNHPLVVASRIGNTAVAKFVIDWIRDTKATFTPNALVIKTAALKMAARGGHVAIANLMITTPQHAHNFVAGLIVNGHVDMVRRFAAHPMVDFKENEYELLRLCAPYPKVLNYIMRHPSLASVQHAMPTEYSNIAMQSAVVHYYDTVSLVESSFKRRIALHANAKIQASGASVKDAVMETFVNLNQRHKKHMDHGSIKQFSF
jgi:hypothetical protein